MDDKNKGFSSAVRVLPEKLQNAILDNAAVLSGILYEINLRTNSPVILSTSRGRYYLTENGRLTADYSSRDRMLISKEELKDIFMRLCSYSVYHYQQDINAGFLTIGGGCRAGICGTAFVDDGRIISVKNISSVSLRIARECIGCADEVMGKVDPLKGVLICGAPSTGKTTLLRDMARSLSYRYKVSLIDERNELSSCADGEAQTDVGLCDVYAGYPKSQAIMQAIRAMSPDIIICDELGDSRDIEALRYALFCGVSFIATVHGESEDRPAVRELLDTGAFSYLVTLHSRRQAGRVREVKCLS